MSENKIIDELYYRSYAHNRMAFPSVEPERWAVIFDNVPEMEERFLRTLIKAITQGESVCSN